MSARRKHSKLLRPKCAVVVRMRRGPQKMLRVFSHTVLSCRHTSTPYIGMKLFVETLTPRVRLSVLSATQRPLRKTDSSRRLSAVPKMGVSPNHVLARSRAVQNYTRDLATNRFMSHAGFPLLRTFSHSYVQRQSFAEKAAPFLTEYSR